MSRMQNLKDDNHSMLSTAQEVGDYVRGRLTPNGDLPCSLKEVLDDLSDISEFSREELAEIVEAAIEDHREKKEQNRRRQEFEQRRRDSANRKKQILEESKGLSALERLKLLISSGAMSAGEALGEMVVPSDPDEFLKTFAYIASNFDETQQNEHGWKSGADEYFYQKYQEMLMTGKVTMGNDPRFLAVVKSKELSVFRKTILFFSKSTNAVYFLTIALIIVCIVILFACGLVH